MLLGGCWDATLSRWDRWLFAGQDPVLLARSMVPTVLYPVFNQVYIALNPVMMGTIFWLVLVGRRVRARRLAAALYFGYFIGVLSYHLMPAYGPAYFIPGDDPSGVSAGANHLQQMLLQHVRMVQADPGGTTLMPWIYIAAFPSLHVSQVLIIAWYFRLLTRRTSDDWIVCRSLNGVHGPFGMALRRRLVWWHRGCRVGDLDGELAAGAHSRAVLAGSPITSPGVCRGWIVYASVLRRKIDARFVERNTTLLFRRRMLTRTRLIDYDCREC